ncbi:phosphodiester glycosidase family protein [Acinetobacter zhairhuonensis]|uniref:phosphodiester glycosidase family protein n=1 Tax=Acinetobacter sp. A7.4 TaxID=2919921 RepID=UPI001F500BBB|nr:phosphodiester glycosidase family protein [Acinetobacter sp. A7.4]MCJ8161792.1 phosphodiester glycosidase family protein [Acinetobacter sp. A7.4]
MSVHLLAQVTSYTRQYHDLKYTVVEVYDLTKLRLLLNKQGNQAALNYFSQIPPQLKACEQMAFAMNAGMFHYTYHPVGLYIEKRKKLFPLNRHRGWGNFYLQPNGVLVWNAKQAVILSTSQYAKRKFKADYATQSGPMLVSNRKINPIFMAESRSQKIRNAVGIKDQVLFFVITEQAVNFYTLASFMQADLGVEQALYLDGSISAVYLAEQAINTQSSPFGPMLAYIEDQSCD